MEPKKRKYKFQMYEKLQKNTEKIYAELRNESEALSKEFGISKKTTGAFGLGGGSFTPPTLPEDVIEAIGTESRRVVSLEVLVDEIREIVKDVYGDDFDVTPTSTAEGALWVVFDVLASPPMTGRGDNYRSRYIAPYERHMHHQASYGRPFPPKYGDLYGDRGVTAGEWGIYGKRLSDLDTVIVPLEGARYEAHGIKYHTIPILTHVNPEASIEKIKRVAQRHAANLAAFTSLGYDTIGYGYGAKDEEGTSKLQKYIGNLADEYDVPYVSDNARGLPFVGTDPRKIHASVILYSMDKAAGAPTSGLIIGREDTMIPIRKALGMHGRRSGSLSSYGKAAYVIVDPGKEALAGQVVALRKLRDEPDEITKPRDDLYQIVKDEFAAFDPSLRDSLHISKSSNSTSVEVNYADTWTDGRFGIPIFSIEDNFAGSNLIGGGLSVMGVKSPLAYDGNIYMNPGQGTVDKEGRLIEDRARYAVRGLVKVLETLSKWAGVIG